MGGIYIFLFAVKCVPLLCLIKLEDLLIDCVKLTAKWHILIKVIQSNISPVDC